MNKITLNLFLLMAIAIFSVVSCKSKADVSIPNQPEAPSATLPSLQTTPTMSNSNSALNCQPIFQKLVTGGGYMIVKNLTTNNYQLIDVSTFENSVFFDNYIQLAFAPNADSLAYIASNDPNHIILATKKGLSSFTIDKNFRWLSRWVNDTTMILKEKDDSVTPIMFLNLISGDKSIFDPSSSLHNIYNLTPYETWQGSTLTVFDPSLEYVVYPRMSANSAELVLFDVDSNKVTASVSPMVINFAPEWSPNGDSFVVVEPLSITTSGFPNQFELIKVSKTGEIKTITALNKKYPNALINSYKWSPNGRFLAFWLNLDVVTDPTTSYLAILGTETNELTITCLSSNINIYDYNPPIWSPDSSLLAVTTKVEESGIAHLSLVDIKNYNYSTLDNSESLIPLGWLNFMPK